MANFTKSSKPVMIRFYGFRISITRFRSRMYDTIGKMGNSIEVESNVSTEAYCSFTVRLTREQRKTLYDTVWKEESGTGSLANGVPFRFNDCITYREEI